jgi:hypothetical protein
MQLFRGTPESESIPSLREFPCVFFASRYSDVVHYSGARKGRPGYVQEYTAPDTLKILDLDDDLSLATEFLGRKLSPLEVREFSYHPSEEWVLFLKERGFDGIAFDYLCLWNFKGLKLKRRWRVDYLEGIGEHGQVVFPHERIDR